MRPARVVLLSFGLMLTALAACPGSANRSDGACGDEPACPEREFCVDGACRPQGWCEVDAECPGQLSCREHRCVSLCDATVCVCAPDGRCLHGLECEVDGDCAPSEWCENGFCRERPGTGEGAGP